MVATVSVEIPCFMFGQVLKCGDIKQANKVPKPALDIQGEIDR